MLSSSQRLYLIPARGGSKGIPGKNIKLLNGKPLIHYAIEYARTFAEDKDIYVSTDDNAILECAKETGLTVPLLRPSGLATDDAGMFGVIQHALNVFAENRYEQVVLLQPTSPLRQIFHLQEALKMFNSSLDMIASVCHSKANPYFNLFEENDDGFLSICKKSSADSRQKAPSVYLLNGAIYIINVASLHSVDSLSKLMRVKKYIMEREFSIDIDDEFDWLMAEQLLKKIKDAGRA